MRLSVNNPDEVTAVIPHMLGFAPTESLVVMPMGAGLPVARIDLPRTAEDRAMAVQALLNPYLRNAGPDAKVALVAFTDSGQAAEDASRQIGQEMTAHGLPVVFRLWVTEQTWTDLGTGQGGDRTLDAQTRMAALFVADGRRTPAESRDALRSSFAGDPGPVAAELPVAVARSNPLAAERTWVAERVGVFERDGNRLSDADTARLLVAVQRVEIRDEVLMRMSRDNAPQHRALWSDVTSRAPEEVRTPAATLAGFSTWLNGDGAGAWTALAQIPAPPTSDELSDRPESAFGRYALAGMLAQALEEGVNPAAWDVMPPGPTAVSGNSSAVAGLRPLYEPPNLSTRPDLSSRPGRQPGGPRRLPDSLRLNAPPSSGPQSPAP